MPRNAKKQNEPILLVKPASRMFGLDYLHVSLIVLVIILIGLAFALSGFKPGPTLTNCPYGVSNGSVCANTVHSSSQVLSAAEMILASYSATNSSLSLIPYYSLINKINVSYAPSLKEWLVVVPYIDPLANNQMFYMSLLLYDSNLSLATPFIQSLRPITPTQNQAVALGTISIYGKSLCSYNTPIQVYDIVDPYAPGSIQSFYTGINATKEYGNKINVTYKVVFTGFAIDKYKNFGINQTQAVGESLWCASKQPQYFQAYLNNFTILYTYNPLPNTTMSQFAAGAGMNMTQYNACMLRAPQVLNAQALLTQFYGITITPAYIVNCKYLTLPQTLNDAIGYSLGQIANGTANSIH